MCLYLTVQCAAPARFRVVAADDGKPNSRYVDRIMKVDGKKTVHLKFPISPDAAVISVANIANPSDASFTVTIEEKPLVQYAVWLDGETRQFLKLAEKFSQSCGFMSPHHMGREFKTSDEKFRIKYFPTIVNYATGQQVDTPARIGHSTGIIEVAKNKFDDYTVPMRMCILLHEFSHVYRNPKNNLPISHEQGADLNSLYIFLGLGYSKIDAINVYGKVFLKAKTPQNLERMRNIINYIQRFEKGEVAQIA